MKFRGHLRVEHLHRAYHQYAGVTLSLTESDTYRFESLAVWPKESYERDLERGIRAGLADAGYDADAGVHVVVESVSWDDLWSCATAFHEAGKHAIASGPTEIDTLAARLEALPAVSLREDHYCARDGTGRRTIRITHIPTGESVMQTYTARQSSYEGRQQLLAELERKVAKVSERERG